MLITIFISNLITSFLIIYAFTHKEKLDDLEDKLKKKFRSIKIKLCIKWLGKEGIVLPKEGGK